MKKSITVILAGLIILGLLLGSLGCSQSSPTPTPTPTSKPSPTTTTTSTPSPTTTTAKPIVLKVASAIAPPYPLTLQLENAMQLIKTRSGGRVEFEYHPSGSLYNLAQMSDAIMKNLIQMANFKGGYYVDKMGIAAEIANLPFNYPFDGFAARTRDKGGFFDWISPYYAKVGVKLWSYPVLTPLAIISKKPVRKMEDLKGLLVRSVAGGSAEGFKLLGAQPVLLATGEIYEALQRGTVDATCSTISSIISDKYMEPAKYFTKCDYSTAGIEQVMNLETFNGLPADIQKIITDAFLETENAVWKEIPGTYNKDLETLKANKVEVIILDAAEIARWRTATSSLFDTYAKKYGAEWDQFMKIRDTMWK